MDSIRRDFLVGDLQQAMEEGGIDVVVTVQARQSVVETEWLLDLVSRHEFMRGVVGWVPLADPLSDHFKSGQRLSLQNRPTEVAVQD